jgi:hypothetical protein
VPINPNATYKLFKLGAVREPTEAELAVARQMAGIQPEAPAAPATGVTETDEANAAAEAAAAEAAGSRLKTPSAEADEPRA